MSATGREPSSSTTVPPPLPPDDADAWYAPDVRAQYEVHPNVVATVRETATGFAYRVREPVLGTAGADAMARVREHFSAASGRRPLTREGAVERAESGFAPKYERVLDRLLETSAATRRRVDYHALCELRMLGDLTPLALDGRIDVVDAGGDAAAEPGHRRLVVHTEDYAPATTEFGADAEYVSNVAGERLTRYTVPFCGFGVDVAVYRQHVLGSDQFTTKYAVLEPDLLPGDEELIEECKSRIWEANVERVVEDRRAFVGDRAEQFLSRRLTARNTRAWLDAATFRLKRALAEYDLAVPPVNSRFADDRLDDLVYYVLRDYVGESILTVPIRDPHLEDIEANRVGERVKVVPRTDVVGDERRDGRVPTNLRFDEETAFVNVVTQLAASDGTELNATTPSAKVNLDPPTVDETIRCAVALPVISEGGPHVSIRKQSPEAMTPVDLVDADALSTELVTLLWLLYEHHGVVLFSGPTGVGKTTLMNAHMPFIPYDDRPISIDEGSREVDLPHETGVSLTTRDHENEYKRVTMADLMTETNYLNPDVEVIAEINTPASFETFAETLNTGHGVIGTTHAEDIETLVNRVVEQGLPPYLLRELDLVVFPRKVDGERYVGEVVELLSPEEYETVSGRCGVVEKQGVEVYWNTVAWRDTAGEFHLDYGHPQLGDDSRTVDVRTFERLASRTDRDVDAVEAEFHRKHRYVQYLVREGVSDVTALFEFLADLRTDEAATVERVSRQLELAERRRETGAESEAVADGGVGNETVDGDSRAGSGR
ncbi:Type IV secretory pathway ATPase VirB11/Archaellum biosynthesis ATPase [Halogranum gelatinilyticum]|uniref:Type IV secretory pathway ATPase VirB11/Archaellum biosynthesis ATPase n=1 Tax=Halogranum gelatinilyticum TaxID=660521 RepID=A0A1G9Q9C7_9EURY|nr:type II/IV secretion system ATPase subunit [Halogranum gelatinilyticum]SDM07658.1 Type IV secretory pathway ATPase VirB11/Archaellum biosynthesis ATPase [Halogranum gelatinilyticum]